MDNMSIKGEWNVVKGKVKQQWGKLTDDDITRINGKRDELIGTLQKAYGRTREQLQSEVDRWERDLDRAEAVRR